MTATPAGRLNCDSCHRPHEAATAGGRYILEAARGQNTDPLAIQPEVDYTPVCHGCHARATTERTRAMSSPGAPPLEDAQVVRQVLRGKQEAFGVLVERYQKPIFNFIYRFYGNYELAQELTQETFLRCYQFLKSYDPERKFSTWLYTVAKNLCIDELKKQRSAHEVPLDDVLPAIDARDVEGPSSTTSRMSASAARRTSSSSRPSRSCRPRPGPSCCSIISRGFPTRRSARPSGCR